MSWNRYSRRYMPNINEFIGPKPTNLPGDKMEKIIGIKPCSKCNLDSSEYYWDPVDLIMTWECPDGHKNTYKVN